MKYVYEYFSILRGDRVPEAVKPLRNTDGDKHGRKLCCNSGTAHNLLLEGSKGGVYPTSPSSSVSTRRVLAADVRKRPRDHLSNGIHERKRGVKENREK